MTCFTRFGLALVLTAAVSAGVSAQDRPAAGKVPTAPETQQPSPTPSRDAPSLKVQVVFSRFDGDKRLSSMPYTMSVATGLKGILRIGKQVPVPIAGPGVAPGGNGVNVSYSYRDVGTNIDCFAFALDDGRFRLDLTIDESAVEDATNAGGQVGAASFRSFRVVNSVVLKDGQSAPVTSAVDKMTGIVTKVDVLLTVVK